MSDNDKQTSTNEEENEDENENKISTNNTENIANNIVETVISPKKSNKTSRQLAKDAKEKAIEKFKNGQVDDEYRVVKCSNGKYRCYKRKEPLPPTPINVNQVMSNKPTVHDAEENTIANTKNKGSKTEHNPMDDIVYYNLTNQISEQLNKRLDMVNEELQRLRNKNSKLKNKYKNLKQAIFIEEDEENNDEPEPKPQDNRNTEETQPQQQLQTTTLPMHIRRNTGINFNKFFN